MRLLLLPLLLALTLLAAPGPALATDPLLDEGAFTAAFLSRLQQQLPKAQWKLTGPLALSSHDDRHRVLLDNGFAAYRSGRESLDSLVAQRVAVVQRLEALSGDVTAQGVMALLKPSDYLEHARAQLQRMGAEFKELPLVHAEAAEGLVWIYAQDLPEGMRMLSPKNAEALQLDAEALRELAQTNLQRHVQALGGLKWQRLAHAPEVAIYQAALDRNYEASAALLPGALQALPLRGDPVLLLLARDTVLVAGSDDAVAVALLHRFPRERFEQMPYAISRQPYRLRQGRLQPLQR